MASVIQTVGTEEADRPPFGIARVRSVTDLGGSSLLGVEGGAGRLVDVVVRAVPDTRSAAAQLRTMRRVRWVRIDVTPRGVHCEVAGTTRRPVQAPLTIGAALGLAGMGVPTFLVRTGGRG